MILGMGVDLCMIPRIEAVLSRYGEAFLHRVFTEEERRYVERFKGEARIGGYAKRWAAKEACAKALGTGFAHGVFFQDIHVGHDDGGVPHLNVYGGARAALERMIPVGQRAEFLVSLSDDLPFALAHVLIQAFPVTVAPALRHEGKAGR